MRKAALLILASALPAFAQQTAPATPAPASLVREGVTEKLTDHVWAIPDGSASLAGIEIAGDPQRVSEWLGESVEAPLEDVKVEWVAPHGTPGILAAQVQTPAGIVRI